MIQPDLFSPQPVGPAAGASRTEAAPNRQSATDGKFGPRKVETHKLGTGTAILERALDMPGILERLSRECERPRYCFMVLNLIAQAARSTGSAGPWIRDGERSVPVRDWLCEALAPVAQRDPRRRAITGRVRADLEAKGEMPGDPAEAARAIEAGVAERIRLSGRTNVSRAVSQLVRAGLVRRHYQGYRVDHHNRGAQRQAVYTVSEDVRRAMRAG